MNKKRKKRKMMMREKILVHLIQLLFSKIQVKT
jgi:hypothetical protein